MRTVLLLTLFPCLCYGSGDTKDKLTSVAYPTKGGTEWTYVEGKRDQTFKLTAVTQTNGEQVLEISERRESKWVVSEKLLQSKSGLLRVERLGSKIEPPVCLLPNPSREGDKWERQITDKAKAIWTIGKSEIIKVPAGQFHCIPVKSQLLYGDGSSSSYTYWYADKIGLVKITGDEAPLELKTFTIGKD
jgi:hypothetical protein